MNSCHDAEGDPFAAGDAIAGHLLASLAPLRFAESSGARESEAAFRLRYRAVVERGMAAAERFPDGLERDAFDSSAVQVIGWDGDHPIATCRLVFPSDDRPLPIEQRFHIRLDGDVLPVELGRAVVDPQYRGRGHGVFMGLAARAWLCMRARGFTSVVAATPAALVKLFETLGFALTVLGPSRSHWGDERCPILCDGRATIPSIQKMWAASADRVNG